MKRLVVMLTLVLLCLVLAQQAWALEAPTDVILTFNAALETVTVTATVDQEAAFHYFDIVREGEKGNMGIFVARKQRAGAQRSAAFRTVSLPPSGSPYIARVVSSDGQGGFTSPAYSTQDIPYPGSGSTCPIADAGNDQVVTVGVTVILNGSGSSDPNNDGLSFQWVQVGGTAVTLENSNTVTPSFVPSSVGEYVFRITVYDDDANEPGGPGSDAEYNTDTVRVTVATFQISAGPDQQVLGGAIVYLRATGSTGQWVLVSGPVVVLADQFSKETTFTAPWHDSSNPDNNVIVLEWCDDHGGGIVVVDAVIITVVNYSMTAYPSDDGAVITLSSDAHNGDASLYYEKSDNLGQTWLLLPGSESHVAAFIDASVVLGTTYMYRIAHNGSVVSNAVSVMASAAPVISRLALTPGLNFIIVRINSPNSDVKKAQYRYGAILQPFSGWAEVEPFAHFIIPGLYSRTAYTVEVRAVDNDGNVGPVVSATTCTLALPETYGRRRSRDDWYEIKCFTVTAVSHPGPVPVYNQTGTYYITEADWKMLGDMRDFRDSVLSKSLVGREVISWYYRNGPALAVWLNAHSSAKPIFRAVIVLPAAVVARVALGRPLWGDVFLVIIVGAAAGFIILLGLKRLLRCSLLSRRL